MSFSFFFFKKIFFNVKVLLLVSFNWLCFPSPVYQSRSHSILFKFHSYPLFLCEWIFLNSLHYLCSWLRSWDRADLFFVSKLSSILLAKECNLKSLFFCMLSTVEFASRSLFLYVLWCYGFYSWVFLCRKRSSHPSLSLFFPPSAIQIFFYGFVCVLLGDVYVFVSIFFSAVDVVKYLLTKWDWTLSGFVWCDFGHRCRLASRGVRTVCWC